jgi:hypothetical protein
MGMGSGLLDWLGEGLIGGGGPTGGNPMMPGPGGQMGEMNPMGDATGGKIPLPTAAPAPTGPLPAPMPFTNETGFPAQPPMPPAAGPYPTGGDPMQANPPPGPGPYPQGGDPMQAMPGMPPGIPIPQARPPGADVGMNVTSGKDVAPLPGGGAQPPLPPTDISARAGGPMTPAEGRGIIKSYEGAGGNAFAPAAPGDGASTAKTIIGRALGLDGNRETQIRGALGAGFKAAGNSSGKSPMQAFASGAGEGMEGGSKSDDKTTEQQDKYLGRKIAAKGAENTELNGASTRELNMARTKLALEQAKMTKEAGVAGYGGKASTANSQQQLYLRGQALANNDPEVKLAKSTYDGLIRQGYPPDSKEVKAAADAHKALVEAKKNEHMGALGLKPDDVAKMGKQPGMAKDNPVPAAGLTKEKFDALPPGSYFVNPKTKEVLVKKGAPAPAAGANPQAAPQQGMTPAMPPAPPAVTAPAGSRADNPDDEE